MAWEGLDTNTAEGFDALRFVTNRVQCVAERASAGSEATAHRTLHPLQLLCRALHLAPPSYHRFELAAAQPDEPLYIQADTTLTWPDRTGYQRRCCGRMLGFDSVATLAVALQPIAVAEGLRLHVLGEGGLVVLSRMATN